jgi:transcription elongation factor GreB
MNKAFTRESDGDTDEDLDSEGSGDASTDIAANRPNYMTPGGYARLKAELLDLIDRERPKVVEVVHWAAGNGDRSENGDYLYGKKKLREIDRRIRFLTRRLEIASITDPSVHVGSDQVFFGAHVRYEDADGAAGEVMILGVDEADSAKGEVSWVAPVARALLGCRVGDVVHFERPSGAADLEVIAVNYPSSGVPSDT